MFAGAAVAVRPTAEMLAAAEDSAAQSVLVAEPEAVGVYDHVPVRAGAAVFTMDTASEVFMLHSGKVSSTHGTCRPNAHAAVARCIPTFKSWSSIVQDGNVLRGEAPASEKQHAAPNTRRSRWRVGSWWRRGGCGSRRRRRRTRGRCACRRRAGACLRRRSCSATCPRCASCCGSNGDVHPQKVQTVMQRIMLLSGGG